MVGDDLVERILLAGDIVRAGNLGSALQIVLGHIRQQVADQGYTLLLGIDGKLRNTALGGVHRGASELLLRYVLARDGLHDLRAREEHVRGLAAHDDEVGQGRRIDGTAGAGTEDSRDLRDHTRRHHVTHEDVGISRVVQTDAGCTVAHGHIHHLADLLRHRYRQRAGRNREILCEDIYQTALDGTVTCYHAVAEGMFLLHTEIIAAVRDEHIELLEAALVQKHMNTLAGRVLALRMLFLDSLLTAAQTGHLTILDQIRYLLFLNFAHRTVMLIYSMIISCSCPRTARSGYPASTSGAGMLWSGPRRPCAESCL